MGPKKGNMMAKNHIGMTTGSRASALKHMLFVSCTPTTFSHTKYRGVQANPNVMNCNTQDNKIYITNLSKMLNSMGNGRKNIETWWMSIRITAASRNPVWGRSEKALEWSRSWSPKAQYTATADGIVRVNTYKVATRYMYLNFWGFHIACMISLEEKKTKENPEPQLVCWEMLIIGITCLQ